MKEKILAYAPGVILFITALVVCALTYQDYGIAWDEPFQRGPGLLNYNYAFHNDHTLFQTPNDNHGAAFEMLLVILEQKMKIIVPRDVYLMRHIATHILFLLSALAMYILSFRLYKSRLIASLCFVMLIAMPRLYAHSFFNSKDLPFLSMTLITLTTIQAAFEKQKKYLFLLAGLACGYATGIRIMGIMQFCFILFFLIIDSTASITKKEKIIKSFQQILLFVAGFLFATYVSWPYIWKHPIVNFVDSYRTLAHYTIYGGDVFFQGKTMSAQNLPWIYIPTWLIITTPIIWLIAGCTGIACVCLSILKNPVSFLGNNSNRNLLLFLLSFTVPIVAIISLNSVVYDDWRHLYFIYPPFVLMAAYAINRMNNKKLKVLSLSLSLFQASDVIYFMVRNHPFHEVYFNEFVSHDNEYLRLHYDLDYWGPSFKQGLEYLLKTDLRKTIHLCRLPSADVPLDNNILMLETRDIRRIDITDVEHADYMITNFRTHPKDYTNTEIKSFRVLNSTILRIYKIN